MHTYLVVYELKALMADNDRTAVPSSMCYLTDQCVHLTCLPIAIYIAGSVLLSSMTHFEDIIYVRDVIMDHTLIFNRP